MKTPSPYFLMAFGLAGAIAAAPLLVRDAESPPVEAEAAVGNLRALETAYETWLDDIDDDSQTLNVSLGYSKGLSARYAGATGKAKFNLSSGSVTIRTRGLPEEGRFEAWLIDNKPGTGRSVKPERGDDVVLLGPLQGPATETSFSIDQDALVANGFQIDLVAIAPEGAGPEAGGWLFGAPTLFQKLYFERAGLTLVETRDQARTGTGAGKEILNLLVPRPAYAAGPGGGKLDALIARGERLFFKETFNGNGRTCGTCHRAENNFTIDPKFIASLPDDDPLFVAEFDANLMENFENPRLMRELGLILENNDGFDDLANDFNMRGVTHTLALRTSIESTQGPRTGWGGDGAPGGGTLREFAIGAVIQHFTKSLHRTHMIDFRLPTDAELDALEAFQLSLGRQEELQLPLSLSGPVAANGQAIFLDNSLGKCNRCHLNAGANVIFGAGNRNFDTGVEHQPDQPQDLTDELVPPDDGFGIPGNGEFNSTTLVEAADTGPFFHNNSIATLEGAVAFYNGAAFNDSPAGAFVGGIQLDATQVEAVAAFLRVINALENIRSAIDLERRALNLRHRPAAKRLLRLARAETADAIEVLERGDQHHEAVLLLRGAADLLPNRYGFGRHKKRVRKAIKLQEAARKEMLDE